MGNNAPGLKKILSKEEAKAAIQKLKTTTTSVAFVAITKTKEVEEKERDERLKEKYSELKRKKFVEGFASPSCRCAHIKSVGNGL